MPAAASKSPTAASNSPAAASKSPVSSDIFTHPFRPLRPLVHPRHHFEDEFEAEENDRDVLEYSFGSDAGEASIVGETSSGFEGGETSTSPKVGETSTGPKVGETSTGPKVGETSTGPQVGETSCGSLTVHTNPGWLNTLKRNFVDVVISRCCRRTIEAVEANEIIQV